MAKTWGHPCPSGPVPGADYWTDAYVCPLCGFDPQAALDAEHARLRELEDNAEAMAQTRKIIHHLKKLEVCRETIGVLEGLDLFWSLETPDLMTLRARQNPRDMYLELPLASRWFAQPPALFTKGAKS